MVSALVALGCGLYAYFAPLTGVTGVWGPLAAAFGALCLLLGAALMVRSRARGARFVLMALIAVGLLLSALAAFLMHQWVMLAAFAVCAIGWIAALSGPEGDLA
ncbi:hypothetical protein IQ782_27225 [Salipiger pacificus]|uniref:MerC mercury resistance protein n=2 Tax=Salipiger mangrovisoli TaxID=2865933 RepID=A0ABR9XAK5_9RHOB|nr:hypothetical protein [Salipiger mangrovisoli]